MKVNLVTILFCIISALLIYDVKGEVRSLKPLEDAKYYYLIMHSKELVTYFPSDPLMSEINKTVFEIRIVKSTFDNGKCFADNASRCPDQELFIMVSTPDEFSPTFIVYNINNGIDWRFLKWQKQQKSGNTYNKMFAVFRIKKAVVIGNKKVWKTLEFKVNPYSGSYKEID